MDSGMFGRKYIFFEKTYYHINKDNGTQQAQQNYADTNASGKQFV
jgi:hypothetical protein